MSGKYHCEVENRQGADRYITDLDFLNQGDLAIKLNLSPKYTAKK